MPRAGGGVDRRTEMIRQRYRCTLAFRGASAQPVDEWCTGLVQNLRGTSHGVSECRRLPVEFRKGRSGGVERIEPRFSEPARPAHRGHMAIIGDVYFEVIAYAAAHGAGHRAVRAHFFTPPITQAFSSWL